MAKLIQEIAAVRGDDVALVDERGETTWADFDERTNRLIDGLRTAGVPAGATVALMSGNRRELFEATAACGHAGWLMVPVNWHWTANELAYVLDDSDSVALVVEDQFADVAVEALKDPKTSRCATVVMVGESTLPDGFVAYEELLASASPDEPTDQAMGGPMFYTSGTTGFPKGVKSSLSVVGAPVEVMELVSASFVGMLGLPEAGVTLLEGPAYHSAQWVFSVFPLLRGHTVVMRHKFDPIETLELIDRYQVTNVHLVPAQLIRLLKADEAARSAFDGSSLKAVYHGAAPCPPEVKRQMLDWWGSVVHEYYGGTEGGFLTVIKGEDWVDKPGSIGKAIDMVELMILDDDGEPVPPGTPGQIWFRSLMGSDFEYHKAPEKTAEAHREPGVGTLGDIGYADEDGFVFLSDRKIDMIISGGVNIYPAEIEGVLVSHPAVADVAVFGIPDDDMGESVKAAIELLEGFDASPELEAELVAHVREQLAGYKAPRSIDFEAGLPRTPTGKLMKRLLRDPYWEGSGRSI